MMNPDTCDPDEVSLTEKVSFMSRPASYPHQPDRVSVTETHMSWVFLTGGYVYKLKKPVRYAYLDFTSLASRAWNCREELRLNSRLAAGVYLGVVPLSVSEPGTLRIGGDGHIVDWLVWMKQLPNAQMLDSQIAAGSVDASAVNRMADHLIRFYSTAAPVPLSAEWLLEGFRSENQLDSIMLSDTGFDLDHALTERIITEMRAALISARPLIEARVERQVHVEGHGDLRPEHICLGPEPAVIDCLEFNRDLRLLDPFDELAFLDLECERLGAAWVGRVFLSRAMQALANPAPPALMHFYRASRALLRARLALAHLTEPNPRTPKKWEPRARHYIALAGDALSRYASLLHHDLAEGTREER